MYLSQESDDHTPDVLTNHGGGGEGGGVGLLRLQLLLHKQCNNN